MHPVHPSRVDVVYGISGAVGVGGEPWVFGCHGVGLREAAAGGVGVGLRVVAHERVAAHERLLHRELLPVEIVRFSIILLYLRLYEHIHDYIT